MRVVDLNQGYLIQRYSASPHNQEASKVPQCPIWLAWRLVRTWLPVRERTLVLACVQRSNEHAECASSTVVLSCSDWVGMCDRTLQLPFNDHQPSATLPALWAAPCFWPGGWRWMSACTETSAPFTALRKVSGRLKSVQRNQRRTGDFHPRDSLAPVKSCGFAWLQGAPVPLDPGPLQHWEVRQAHPLPHLYIGMYLAKLKVFLKNHPSVMSLKALTALI